MWLDEFHDLHAEAAKRYTRHYVDPKAVESELLQAREFSQIQRNVLETLEEGKDHWPYEAWWPRLSSSLKENEQIEISQTPQNLGNKRARDQTVKILYERFKSIENVSVLLRFLYPEEFGILSSPVSNLISLAQARNPVNYYLDYLEVLRGFRDHPKYKSTHLQKVADIDMALWSAAHFSQDPSLEPRLVLLRKEMFQDEYFQEVRFQNILKGLGTHWNQTDSQYLAFARAFLRHDCRISSLIVARVYENLIMAIGGFFEKTPSPNNRTWPMVYALDGDSRMKQFGVQRGQLVDWWKLRKRAVHNNPPLEQWEAQTFVNRIEQLQRGWTKAMKPK